MDIANRNNVNADWPSDAVEQICHMRDVLKMSWTAIAVAMGRTALSVQDRYYKSKSQQPRGPQRWTQEEIRLLSTLRGEHSLPWADVSLSLPGRSVPSCQARFRALVSSGSSPSRSFSTVVSLAHHHQRVTVRGIFSYTTRRLLPTLRCNASAFQHRLLHTGEKAPKRAKPFTEEETRIIFQRRQQNVSFPDIATEIGRSSRQAINTHFRRKVAQGKPGTIRRRNPLSDSELEQIAQKRAKGVSWLDIGLLINRSPNACYEAHAQNIRRMRQSRLQAFPRRSWTEAEIASLINLRGHLGQSWAMICESLNRTPASVRGKYCEVMLDGKTSRPTIVNGYSSEEDDMVCYLREVLRLGWKKLQQKLPHRTVPSIKGRYYTYLAPEMYALHEHAREKFTVDDYALLDDLRNTQHLSWEAVQAKMPKWSIEDLQNRHALLTKWPPSKLPSPATKSKKSSKVTDPTEKSP